MANTSNSLKDSLIQNLDGLYPSPQLKEVYAAISALVGGQSESTNEDISLVLGAPDNIEEVTDPIIIAGLFANGRSVELDLFVDESNAAIHGVFETPMLAPFRRFGHMNKRNDYKLSHEEVCRTLRAEAASQGIRMLNPFTKPNKDFIKVAELKTSSVSEPAYSQRSAGILKTSAPRVEAYDVAVYINQAYRTMIIKTESAYVKNPALLPIPGDYNVMTGRFDG